MNDLHRSFDEMARRRLVGGEAVLCRHASGAEVIFDQNPHQAPVSVVTIDAPVADDSGVAHVLEHLVFRGSRLGQVDDLYADLMLGGPVCDLNATTRAERTSFHLTSASAAGRDEALAVLLEAILAPALRTDAFEQERAIIIGEMAGEWADPARAVLAALRGVLFPATPHARAHGGLPAALAGLSCGDVAAFHGQFYRPPGMRIHLMGPPPSVPDLDRLDALLRGASGGVPMPPPMPPPTLAARAAFVPPLSVDPGDEALGIGWRLPDARGVTAEILSEVLAGPVGPFADRGRWPLLATQGALDGPVPDLRLAFAPRPAAEVAAIRAALDGAVEAALPRMAAAFAARLGVLAEAVTAETGPERHERIVARWCRGEDPLRALDREAEVARLLCDVPDPAAAAAYLGRILAPGNRVCVAVRGTPAVAHPAARRSRPPRRTPPEVATTCRTPAPDPRPLPMLRPMAGAAHLVAEAPDGAARRVLLLPLEGVGLDDLPLAAGLVRHWAGVAGLLSEPLVGEGAGFILLRGSVRAEGAERLDARLARIFRDPVPPPAGLPAPPGMPMHLRMDLRLRAALCESGALAHSLNRPMPEGASAEAVASVREALLAGARLVVTSFSARSVLDLLPAARRAPAAGQGVLLRLGDEVWTAPPGAGAAGLGLCLKDEPALPLIAHALEWLWLRERIRREGGAYGVRCRAGAEGSLVFLSARDPEPSASLEVFARSPDWLARALRGELLERARRGMLERLARPLGPDEALVLALAEGVAGVMPRSKVWRAVAEIDVAGVERIAGRLAEAMDGAPRIEVRVSS